MTAIVGKTASVWGCAECHNLFVWHPGASGLKRPSMCGVCSTENQFHLQRLTPAEMKDYGYEVATCG